MLECDVDHESDNEDSDPDSEDSDHYSQDSDSQEEVQEELGHNVVESDNSEDNDEFENEDDVYQANLDSQRQDQRARMRRRNNLGQDEDSVDNVSTSTASTMLVRGIANQLDSNLNPEGYWNIGNGSDNDTDNDGTLFAMLMAEQAGVKMMQESGILQIGSIKIYSNVWISKRFKDNW